MQKELALALEAASADVEEQVVSMQELMYEEQRELATMLSKKDTDLRTARKEAAEHKASAETCHTLVDEHAASVEKLKAKQQQLNMELEAAQKDATEHKARAEQHVASMKDFNNMEAKLIVELAAVKQELEDNGQILSAQLVAWQV